LPDLARAYEGSGNQDSAMVAYERYLSTPWLWRYETDAVELGWAMKRLGELYEEKGETTKAAAALAGLVRLWGRADPELRTVVAQVRQRAERNRPVGAD
jgi:hypothetical protein